MASALSQVILDVNDLERSLGFYVGLLNLELCERTRVDGHSLAMLRAGGMRILLIQQPVDEADLLLDRSRGLVLNFEVRDLAYVVAGCNKAGTTILRGVERSPGGEASLLISDPDGYALLVSGKTEMVN